MTDAKRRCTHTTKAGRPCQAWAVHGTAPPACSIHAGLTRGGPADRNQNARKHGFYAPGISRAELADLIYPCDNLDSSLTLLYKSATMVAFLDSVVWEFLTAKEHASDR